MIKNADMPAYSTPSDGPCQLWMDPTDPSKGTFDSLGLTKREYFAGLAMQQLSDESWSSEQVARVSVERADALLAALENDNG